MSALREFEGADTDTWLAVLGSKMFSHSKASQKSVESSLKGKLEALKVTANEVKEGSVS